jgi:aryl-alcohol dehydrogenase-like predicted oxidoreductase
MLSGKYRPGGERPAGSRFTRAKEDSPRYNRPALERVEALRPIAEQRGITLAQMSLAWLMQQPAVASPILGVRTIEHLRSAVQSLSIRLTQEDLDRIDEVAPPGSAVAEYWDQVMFQRVRQQNLKHRVVGSE